MMHQAFKYHKASVWYRKKINEILKFFKKQEKKKKPNKGGLISMIVIHSFL